MNDIILDLAAAYANAYRANKTYNAHCEDTLRTHISRKFGAVYAAILCRTF